MRAGRARIAALGIAAFMIGGEARSQAPEPEETPAPNPSPSPAEPAGPSSDPSGPVLFADSAPLLPEMWRLATANDAGPKALGAGLAALEDWLRQPSSKVDPLAIATGEWLRALLLTRRHAPEAREAWEALATTPGAFSDEARSALATLDPEHPRGAKGQGGAAHWLLSRSPGAPDYLDGVRRAVHDLTRKKQSDRAADLLGQALELGMADAMRKELVLLRADLLPRAERRALLLDLWWLDEARTPDKRVIQRLKKLDALPDADARLFRDALATPRSEIEGAKKALAKLRKRPPLAPIVNALYDRYGDDDACAAALAKLPGDDDPSPYRAYTRAILLRKLDKDADAVLAFEAVIAFDPDHPLADLARAQASVLLRGLGRPDEARPLDEALLASAPPGELQRDALWRLGFAAVIVGDGATAETHLRALETRFGGDPDRHSFSWYERARYWRGRAALLRDERASAREHFDAVIQRFPAGWYALLARDRLEASNRAFKTPRASGSTRGADTLWDIPRDDPMATALALYRLGAEERARETFDALLAARQLPGNGRKLLADLYDLDGRHKDADRVLRYAAIPATMPGEDPDDLYLVWYPFPHSEAVTDAARDNHLPSQLLAGIVSVETRFQEKGRSKVGAIGLAQLMPTTGQAVGRKLFGKSFSASQLWDPATNLAVAANYLGSLLDRFAGHPALAVLAYNAGPAPVRRWLAERGELELDAFVETIPFEQARRYVMRVCADAEIYRRLYALDREPLTLPRKFSSEAKKGDGAR